MQQVKAKAEENNDEDKTRQKHDEGNRKWRIKEKTRKRMKSKDKKNNINRTARRTKGTGDARNEISMNSSGGEDR